MGSFLDKHFKPRDGDRRELVVEDVSYNVPVDLDNDGVTDQKDGVDIIEVVKKTSYNNH